MFKIICIFALWIGWFGHQSTRGKSVAPSIFSMTDMIKVQTKMEKKNKGRGKDVPHFKKRRIVCGVGINDSTSSTRTSDDREPAYVLWKSVLVRCYRYNSIRRQTYSGCSVCEEWLSYSGFKRWFDENFVNGYHIDKDILIRGNKVYSPETCCFVPPEINTLLVKCNSKRGNLPIGVSAASKNTRHPYRAVVRKNGKNIMLGYFSTPEEAFMAYKDAKELHIKEMAKKYFNRGLITEKVYNALMRWEVKITD